MKEIKIRFFGHREYCQEMWEVFTEEGRPRRYLLRDSEGYGTWHYASDPDDACEPGFATQDDITLILCDKNWNEHARTGNDRTRFPAFFPTLIDACQQGH